MIEKLKKYKFSIIWAVVMMIGCTIKIELPQDDGDSFKFKIPHFDKILHFGIYMILSALICVEKRFLKLNDKIKILIFSALYGIVIEIIQYFEPWRSFELADILADTLGALAGILISKWLITRIYR